MPTRLSGQAQITSVAVVPSETPPCGTCVNQACPFWLQAFPAPRRGGAFSGKLKVVKARNTVLHGNEASQHVHTLFLGWAFSFMRLPDGRRQILSFYLPGDLIGRATAPLEPLHFSVQALTDITLCVHSAEEVEALASGSPKFMSRLNRIYYKRAVASDHHILGLGLASAIEKIVWLILYFHARMERRNLVQDGSFYFPLRQEHIADALGLTKVHVSRTISMLRKEGLLEVDNQIATVPDENQLLAYAGFDSGWPLFPWMSRKTA